MSRLLLSFSFLLAVAFSTATLSAAELSLSLGIRQTLVGDLIGDLVVESAFDQEDGFLLISAIGGFDNTFDLGDNGIVDIDDLIILEQNDGFSVSGVIGDDGGTTSSVGFGNVSFPDYGIDWVNLDGQTLVADGNWQQFTFTPLTDTLTGFTGIGALKSDWGTLEHIRIGNTADGETQYKIWIDGISNTDSSGTTVFGDFESNAVGDEVIFQEPSFSSGTSGNLLGTPDLATVTDSMAHTGSQSLTAEWEFVDDNPSNWLQLTTENADNTPNPLIQLREGDYSQIATNGTVTFSPTTITFWAKATVVPEPATSVLMLMSVCAMLAWRKRS